MKSRVCLSAIVVLGLASLSSGATLTGPSMQTFNPVQALPRHIDPHIRYPHSAESFFVYVPPTYDGSEPFGLIVFTDSQDRSVGLPAGWQYVLNRREYIFIAAQNAGNDQPRERRLGLAVLGALNAMKIYNIDTKRVYAAGFSGGARMAGMLGFYQSDIFRGTVQNCGADFYMKVPVVMATSQLDTAGKPYGIFPASSEEISGARKVRFALVTGGHDFRRGNILDIFHGGFERNGFQAKLFEIPGMGHDVCDGQTLARVLDFLEGKGQS